MSFWWADNNWSQIADPEFTYADGVMTWNVTVAPGVNQWQAQVKIDTDLVLNADESYDFKMVINPTCDVPGATIKLTSTSDGGNFYQVNRENLVANQPNEFIYTNQTGKNIPDFQLCFDFAGIQANAPLTVTNIIIQKSGSAETDGLLTIEADINSPAVYYNLQGVQVVNPANGLYIMRQGNKVSKVLAKVLVK